MKEFYLRRKVRMYNKEKYTAFYQGQVWYDTKGERIHAHGGSVLYEDGVYKIKRKRME